AQMLAPLGLRAVPLAPERERGMCVRVPADLRPGPLVRVHLDAGCTRRRSFGIEREQGRGDDQETEHGRVSLGERSGMSWRLLSCTHAHRKSILNTLKFGFAGWVMRSPLRYP